MGVRAWFRRTGLWKSHDLDPQEACEHPDHNEQPTGFFPPGIWRQVCPGCYRRRHFKVIRGTVFPVTFYL